MLKKFGVLLLLISFLSVGSFVFAQDGDEEPVDEPTTAELPAKKSADEKKEASKEKGEKKAKKEKKGKKAKKKAKKAKKAKKEAANEEG